MANKPGMMPKRQLAMIYFGLLVLAVAFAAIGLVQENSCHIYGVEPIGWCRWPPLLIGFFACIFTGFALLVIDDFKRGRFDD